MRRIRFIFYTNTTERLDHGRKHKKHANGHIYQLTRHTCNLSLILNTP